MIQAIAKVVPPLMSGSMSRRGFLFRGGSAAKIGTAIAASGALLDANTSKVNNNPVDSFHSAAKELGDNSQKPIPRRDALGRLGRAFLRLAF